MKDNRRIFHIHDVESSPGQREPVTDDIPCRVVLNRNRIAAPDPIACFEHGGFHDAIEQNHESCDDGRPDEIMGSPIASRNFLRHGSGGEQHAQPRKANGDWDAEQQRLQRFAVMVFAEDFPGGNAQPFDGDAGDEHEQPPEDEQHPGLRLVDASQAGPDDQQRERHEHGCGEDSHQRLEQAERMPQSAGNEQKIHDPNNDPFPFIRRAHGHHPRLKNSHVKIQLRLHRLAALSTAKRGLWFRRRCNYSSRYSHDCKYSPGRKR